VKTLKDIQQYCYECKESMVDALIENLEESTPFENGLRQGYILAYEDIADEIRDVLKYHECVFVDSKCVMCGEHKNDLL
jgi:hypothetical protein